MPTFDRETKQRVNAARTLGNKGITVYLEDVDRFAPLLDATLANVRVTSALADAGYDSEANHCHARERRGVRSFIPAKHGRPTAKLPTGRYRRRMKQRLNKAYGRYGQRAQAETGFSMFKRRLGSAVSGRNYWSQCRDLLLMAITYNIMLLLGFQ